MFARIGGLVAGLVFAVVPVACLADDSAAIMAAVNAYSTSAHGFTAIRWAKVQISESSPYAMFFALKGEIGIDSLLQKIHGRWQVTMPSKGVEAQDLLVSYGVPNAIAARLLAQCPPSRVPYENLANPSPTLNPGIYHAPYIYTFKLDATRIAHAKITSVYVPLQNVYFHDGYSERIGIIPAFTAEICAPA